MAVIGGGVASSIIVALANRNNQQADTFQKLSVTVASLTDDLNKERDARRADKATFEQALANLQQKYDEIVRGLEKRISDLEYERNELLVENRRLAKLAGGG